MLIGNYYSIQGSITNNNNGYVLFKNYLYEDAAVKTTNSRATEVFKSDLQPGDILVVDNDYDNDASTSIAEAYIYLDNRFLKCDGSKEYSNDELTNLLNSLIGKSNMILRPTQLIENESTKEIIEEDNSKNSINPEIINDTGTIPNPNTSTSAIIFLVNYYPLLAIYFIQLNIRKKYLRYNN